MAVENFGGRECASRRIASIYAAPERISKERKEAGAPVDRGGNLSSQPGKARLKKEIFCMEPASLASDLALEEIGIVPRGTIDLPLQPSGCRKKSSESAPLRGISGSASQRERADSVRLFHVEQLPQISIANQQISKSARADEHIQMFHVEHLDWVSDRKAGGSA